MDVYEEFASKLEELSRAWKKASWEMTDVQALLWLAEQLRSITKKAEEKASELVAEIGQKEV